MTNNRNSVNNIRTNNGVVVTKVYDDPLRFESEIKYLKIFKSEGYNTPEILQTDKKNLSISFNKIIGKNSLELTRTLLEEVIEILVTIKLKFSNYYVKNETCNAYCNSVEEKVKLFCDKHKLKLSSSKLTHNIDILKKYFDITLFKDSKPSNWIFSNNIVYLIDFDYVVPSFYLADLAQLLSYHFNLPKIKKLEYANKFTVKALPNKVIASDTIKKLYELAEINSNISACKYNQNLENQIIENFEVCIKDNLVNLQII